MVIALLVIPAASARFWTHDLNRMLIVSGVLGGVSCAVGAIASAAFADFPSGATIVLCACGFFLISFVFGKQRGVLWDYLHQRRLARQQEYQHMLRICYEQLEAQGSLPQPTKSTSGKSNLAKSNVNDVVPIREIAERRSWSHRFAMQIAYELDAKGLIVLRRSGDLQLTVRGLVQAEEAVREHRLLEMYMMEQAEADVGQADREADYLEHGLLPEHLAELGENIARGAPPPVPPSPHPLKPDL